MLMLHVEVVQGLLNVKVVETAYRSRMRAVVDKSTTQAQWNLQTQGQSSSAGDRAFLKVWSHAVERIPTGSKDHHKPDHLSLHVQGMLQLVFSYINTQHLVFILNKVYQTKTLHHTHNSVLRRE